MERNKFFGIVMLTMMLIFSFSGLKLNAQGKGDKKEYLKLEVNGLACPFCAYGLEKKLRNDIKSLENLDINIEKGFVTFGFLKQNKPSKEKLKEIVSDAGFQADTVYFSPKPFAKPEKEE
jgi:cation transport ATPase